MIGAVWQNAGQDIDRQPYHSLEYGVGFDDKKIRLYDFSLTIFHFIMPAAAYWTDFYCKICYDEQTYLLRMACIYTLIADIDVKTVKPHRIIMLKSASLYDRRVEITELITQSLLFLYR